VNVSRLVEDSFELLKLMVSKHAKLEFRLAADAPQVRANPGTLRQALINLVTNASEAIGERDGVIHVSTARVSIGPAVNGHELLAGDYVQLAISDTGGGIPQASQARIFDPFFTTKSSGSRPRSRVGNREAPRRGYHR
jgi:signal transduction histidine kinase